MTNRKVIPFKQNGMFHYNKGLKKVEQNKKVEALNSFKKAYEIEEDNILFLAQYVYLLAENNQALFAEQLLMNKFIQHRYDAEFYFLFSQLYFILNDPNKSFLFGMKYADAFPELDYESELEEMFDIGIESRGDVMIEADMFTGQHIFQYLFMNARIDDALNYLNQLPIKLQETKDFRNLKAMALLFLNQYEEAYFMLEQLLKEDQTDMNALSHLTLLYYHTGNEKRYKDSLKKLEVVQPMAHEEQLKVGLVLNFLGQYERAYNLLYPLYKQHAYANFQIFHALSQSSYQLGYESESKMFWQKMLDFHHVDEAQAPWNKALASSEINRIEHQYLHDDDQYVRLIGIYRLSKIEPREAIIGHSIWSTIEQLENYEKMYISHIFQGLKLKRLGGMHRGMEAIFKAGYTRDEHFLRWIEHYHYLYEQDIDVNDVESIVAAYFYETDQSAKKTKQFYIHRFNITRYKFDKALGIIEQNK